MIIGPDFVFLAVPRTASHSIARHWLPQYGGVEADPADHHLWEVPPEHAHKFTWAVVRNPYVRVASWWCLMQKFTKVLTEEMRGVTFEDFPEWLRSGPKPDRHRKWLPQTEFLSEARIDRVVHFENLESELRELPFVQHWIEVPRVNVSEIPHPEITPRFIENVNRYEDRSFDAYGCQRIVC